MLKEEYRYAYDVNGLLEYIGRAKIGTATSAGGWSIIKISYDVNDNPTSMLFANDSNWEGDGLSWDDRATYTYA